MIRSLHVAAPLLLLLVACHSAPRPRLVVRDAFPAAYEGWLRPFAAEDAAAFAAEPAAEAGDGANVTFRATVVELPVAHALDLVPELMLPNLARWRTKPADAGPPGSDHDGEPKPSAVGAASGKVDPDALRGVLRGMRRGPYPTWSVQAVTRVGGAAVLTDTNQTAFVKSIRYARPDAPLVDDFEVASFASGNRLRLATTAHADGLRLDVDWLERTPVRPIPLARGRSGALQVPVFEHHRVTTSAPLAERDAFVIASLPGREPGTVQLLCIDVDARVDSVATR